MSEVLAAAIFVSVFVGVSFYLAPRLIAGGFEWFVLWRIARKDGTTVSEARERYIHQRG